MEVTASHQTLENIGVLLLQFAKKYPVEARAVRWLGYEVERTDEDWRVLRRKARSVSDLKPQPFMGSRVPCTQLLSC